MNHTIVNRRTIMVTATAALLAGCSIIPKSGSTDRPAPPPTTTPDPDATGLPQDQARHRVALLVPLTGENGAAGQSISNATTMAILDTNADNLRITSYDTARGAESAVRQAIADGNKLILGPLLGSNVSAIKAEAAAAKVPIISFSNDATVAGPGVFVMGQLPEQSIARSVEYARSKGARDFAMLVPESEYGTRAEAALRAALADYGGRVVGTERYDRANTSVISAAGRLKSFGGFDTVFIGDGGDPAIRAAEAVKPGGKGALQILGTERWSGEVDILRAPALRGALFSHVPDARFANFVTSYKARFEAQPYRIATLGYDAVLLTLRAARDWKPGTDFPVKVLYQSSGFDGMDGPFRFKSTNVVDRAMEVREVRTNQFVTVSPAPSGF